MEGVELVGGDAAEVCAEFFGNRAFVGLRAVGLGPRLGDLADGAEAGGFFPATWARIFAE